MRLFNGIAKWIVNLALALSAGLLIIIFLSSKPEFGAYLLRLILLAAIGFIGGLTARIFFRGIPVVMAILLSMASNLLAVLVIDNFYETSFQFLFLDNEFRLHTPTASDGSQFLLMSLVSFLPLLLFRRAAKKIPKSQKTRNVKRAHKTLNQTFQPILAKVDPGNWELWKKPKVKKRSSSKTAYVEKPILSVARPNASKTASRPVTVRKTMAAKVAVKKLKLPGNLFRGSQADVKLVGDEEHVCPYCLEEVVRGDMRGVTICPECGTWHHQDCWSLTGSCGVAHRNEL